MSNDLCCIITIKRRDYDHIASKLISFEMQFVEAKQVELCLMASTPETGKKFPDYNKKPTHKCQNAMIRLTDRNYSNYLIGTSNSSGYDDKFIYEASCLRADNNFKNMTKGWSVFSEMKEQYTKKFEIETYSWKKAFQFQFIHGEKDEVLLIMKDCSSCNYVEKNVNSDREFWKTKILTHFRDMYGLFCNNFGEIASNDGHHLVQNYSGRSKIAEFEQRTRAFVEKMEKFSEKNQKSLQFWHIRTACIAEFILKHRNPSSKPDTIKNNTA